jgi:hypothetical protein
MSKESARSLVKRTLEFENPSRVPIDLWTLPWASIYYPSELQQIQTRFPNDIIGSPGVLENDLVTHGDPYQIGTYVDEWGCTFENRQAGVIGEVKNPPINSWEDLDRIRFPNESFSVNVSEVNAFCKKRDQFVLGGCCPRPFERLQFLRGSTNLYMDIGEDRPEFFELLERVHDFYLKELEIWAKTGVDGLSFMDDWGAQRSLLISPSRWREIFKPLYQDYIELAHQHGKYIFMHSDGYIADILPDLIELGLDAINSQLFVMDIESIGIQFAGKITFWGEIDRQHILTADNPETARIAVKRVKQALWKDGGCIAQCEFGAGAKPENVQAVFETWENEFD